jgi:hypothetical protein
MIHTKHYTNKNFHIPSGLIIERVLNLEEKLDGQSIKIKSIFNKEDKDPSMVIFYSEDEQIYRFKDFSSGNYGDAVDIVLEIFGIVDRQDGYRKIIELFKDDKEIPNYINTACKEIKEVTQHKVRKWNNADAAYWKQFGISGSFLKLYNIKPLESYTITITKGEVVKTMDFNSNMCYGYFNNAGELCKIYQPNRKVAKFLKVRELTQGEEQLTYNAKCLIIASSLKDIGAFKSMKLPNIELVAPDSENVTITQEQINKYLQSYEYVFTMFDNDVAGMKAMSHYKKLYGIPYIYFNVEKDIAECVKQHGVSNTKVFFIPIFKNAIARKKNTKIN